MITKELTERHRSVVVLSGNDRIDLEELSKFITKSKAKDIHVRNTEKK